jgi:hypothetical protein
MPSAGVAERLVDITVITVTPGAQQRRLAGFI